MSRPGVGRTSRGRRPPRPPSAAIPGLASRRAAYRALRRVHADEAWAGPAVDAALRGAGLDARDRAFAANLAFSTLRWEGTLDVLLTDVVDRDLADVEPGVLDVLRLGAYQLVFGRVPDRAAVDTSVELARRDVGERTAGFVNGVLRALARSAPQPPEADTEADDAALGLALAMPEWTVALARERFGERAREVLAAGNEPPGLVLRACGDRDALVEELRAAGEDAVPGAHPRSVRVAGAQADRIPAVVDGRATVQDEASMHVVDAVAGAVAPAAHAGGLGQDAALVVDLCAGPGGKSTALAERGLRVVALDVHPARAALVADLAARPAQPRLLGSVAGDGRTPPLHDRIADAVLVDAPCTGLGVVRRRPELRWRRDAGDPARLARLQGELLDAAARLVRPGGALVYSVCTWPTAETRGVVDAFLARSALVSSQRWAPEPPRVAAERRLDGDPGVQLDPAADDTDAMYIAVLRRAGDADADGRPGAAA